VPDSEGEPFDELAEQRAAVHRPVAEDGWDGLADETIAIGCFKLRWLAWKLRRFVATDKVQR